MTESPRVIVIPETEPEAVTGFNPKGMHPGVIDGRRVHSLENTAKPYKSGKGALGKQQARLGRRRSAHSETLRTLPSNVNPLSFKTPGSMNQHKCAAGGRGRR